jgi:hypothetical protein
MSTSTALGLESHKSAIADFCRRHRIVELAFFGSILRDDFGPESDVDVLVTFAPDTRYSLFDLGKMAGELERIIGRSVDLVERQAVEESQNYIRREHILANLEAIYVA